jgi:hypothetical protein
MVSRLPHVLLALYLTLCVLAVGWPGFAWFGARVEPMVLGLPFALAWSAGWALLTCVALALYHRAVGERGA